MDKKIPCNTDLSLIDELLFKPCGLKMTNMEQSPESQEYFAQTFQLSGQAVQFRIAKTTPTKTGQFVTLWKRNSKNLTVPFDISDDTNFYIIASRQEQHFGVFIFSKEILHENGVLSGKTKPGKRGIRVYPPWAEAANKQAITTQQWQTKCFVDLSDKTRPPKETCKLLFKIK